MAAEYIHQYKDINSSQDNMYDSTAPTLLLPFDVFQPFNLNDVLQPYNTGNSIVSPDQVETHGTRDSEPLEGHVLGGQFDLDWDLGALHLLESRDTSNSVGATSSIDRASVGFVDLPVEVRLQVYNLVFSEQPRYRYGHVGPKGCRAPIPPPLTRVCRTIRAEALECWFSIVRIPIDFGITSWWESSMGVQGTPSYEIMNALRESSYPALRKLKLRFKSGFFLKSIYVPRDYLCFAVDLDQKSNTYKVWHMPHTPPPSNTFLPHGKLEDPRIQKVINRLYVKFDEAMADVIKNSKGVGNITFRDYERLIPQPSWRFWGDMLKDDDA